MKGSDKLIKFLSDRKESLAPLLIVTHDYPDPDAISSAFALAFIAKQFYGIKSKIVYGGILSRIENKLMVKYLKIPITGLKLHDFDKYKNIVLVDTQPLFENNSFPKNKRATIVIDQHGPLSKPEADLAIVEPDRSATCEILAEALFKLNASIPPNLATSLVYGILSDTLDLLRVRKENVFKIYLRLLSLCDMRILTRLQNPPHPAEFFNALGKGIKNAKNCGKLIFCHLGFIEDPVLISHTTDLLSTYKKAHWTLCTGRYEGRLHVSLRSACMTDNVGRLLKDIFANRAQAGGHGVIAGGSLVIGKEAPSYRWQQAEKEIIRKLMRRLRISGDCKKTFRLKKHER